MPTGRHACAAPTSARTRARTHQSHPEAKKRATTARLQHGELGPSTPNMRAARMTPHPAANGRWSCLPVIAEANALVTGPAAERGLQGPSAARSARRACRVRDLRWLRAGPAGPASGSVQQRIEPHSAASCRLPRPPRCSSALEQRGRLGLARPQCSARGRPGAPKRLRPMAGAAPPSPRGGLPRPRCAAAWPAARPLPGDP
mmetsp:Transcript_25603/g.78713  ORF Transcript_25603/g.78713 Transcript_25603/m.78713 type:complete len:202 (+) Transcript_25603:269-874(+)